jgi:hypothetical protein
MIGTPAAFIAVRASVFEPISSIAAGLRWAARSASNDQGLVFGDVALNGPSVAALPGLVEPNPYANFLPGSSAPSLREFLVGNLAGARDPETSNP